MNEEPRITINGQELTSAQAMTIRVAVGSFASELNAEGLGDDQHGKAMTAGYLARIDEIHAAMGLS